MLGLMRSEQVGVEAVEAAGGLSVWAWSQKYRHDVESVRIRDLSSRDRDGEVAEMCSYAAYI